MDSLHAMLRSIRPETKAAKSPISVISEFLDHIERLQRQVPRISPPARPKRRGK